MASSSSKKPAASAGDATTPHATDQAQSIWLAGLGALARAQAEGGKAFDALVKQGLALQDQTQALAKEQLAEAAQRMEAIAAKTHALTPGRWNALEGIFEQRVARALAHLGVPDAQALASLESRIEALEKAASQGQNTPRPAASVAKRTAAKRKT